MASAYCDQCGTLLDALQNSCNRCGAALIPLLAAPSSSRWQRMPLAAKAAATRHARVAVAAAHRITQRAALHAKQWRKSGAPALRQGVVAMRPAVKYWPFGAAMLALIAIMFASAQTPWRWADWPVFLFLESPLLIGLAVAVARSENATGALDRCDAWVANRRTANAQRDGRFARWAIRPVLWTFSRFGAWTQPIENVHVRAGIKAASYLYLTGLVVYLAIVVTMIIVVFAIMGIVITLLSIFIDGENPWDEVGARKLRSRMPMGKRGATIVRGSNVFNEQVEGRVDLNGNIHQGTNVFNERKVGRIDGDGNVYAGTSMMNERKVGRMDDHGRVYEGSSVFDEKVAGRIDEQGHVHEGSGFLDERRVGRIVKKD